MRCPQKLKTSNIKPTKTNKAPKKNLNLREQLTGISISSLEEISTSKKKHSNYNLIKGAITKILIIFNRKE